MKKQIPNIAEISVSFNPSNAEKPSIICSIDAYVLFVDFFPKDTISLQESFVAMYLNRANRVLGLYLASTGGITGTIADIRLILSVALKTAATGIMLAHNHPSGSLKPSGADIELTNKIKEAAKFMDINVLDHLILSPEDGKYYSFADEGLI
jgi:DNA repair protein RadC